MRSDHFIVAESKNKTQCFDETNTSNLSASNSTHLRIRKLTQQIYLSTASKKMKTPNQHIKKLWSDCSVGDTLVSKSTKLIGQI